MTNVMLAGIVRRLLLGFVVFCCIFGMTACQKTPARSVDNRMQVVATLFPLYDFARSIAGKHAVVSMLLPPGTEPHSFEPKPEDLIRVSKAGLFVYTSKYMEPWAERIVSGNGGTALRVVNAGQGIVHRAVVDNHASGKGDHDHDHAGVDPHYWLDFALAGKVVDTILAGFVAADPSNAEHYRGNARELKTRLAALDERYRTSLAGCSSKAFLHGGHYTFGYLAARYGLDYHALSGISSDSEPSAERMVQLIRELKNAHGDYLFAEELLSPRLTEALANEAGVGVLMLHGAHNISRDDQRAGVTFFDLMERNLENLKKGLKCR